jgi:Eco57I restriction-modification methylase/MmeI, target recognition domain/MmeI, N-terminal domain
MAKDPELLAHQEWLGYLQPVGLVVSPPALVEAQAYVSRNVIAEQQRFQAWAGEVPVGQSEPVAAITDLRGLLLDVFGWQADDLVAGPDSLTVVLPEYGETLRPTYAVREFQPGPDAGSSPPWLLLLQTLPAGTPLDEPDSGDERHWQVSPQARFERLLRETGVPIGLLVNGTQLRLVYAPRGETSGHLTFPVQAMIEVAGRPMLAALHMLLSQERLFTLPEKQRLPAILAASRRYQNTVSTRLAEQVLAALYELLRGFQAADAQTRGELLRQVLADDPDAVYAGLLTVLLRLVFLLYAEDRGLMPTDRVYVNYYSVTGLFERLRADEGHNPDTMDHRFGAWAQLLTLFRLINDGGSHGDLRLPARKGYLFDPERYPFLEGPRGIGFQPVLPEIGFQPVPRGIGFQPVLPHVSDGVLFRVLQNLLILDGERLSYRTLDVEQIGSVYEAVMGFRLEIAPGPSIAVKAAKGHGAPVAINLSEVLARPAADRGKWLRENTDQSLTGAALNALKAAQSPEDVVAALGRKVSLAVTPNIVAAGSMVLQPSDERRRSGSHYTPRSLTEPIVRTTLKPVLERLGPNPLPDQILGLKVCDPAMGSGAFLVEACRQLGDALVATWHAHGRVPVIPPDEDEVLHARRLVAQRCLYGVDKNPLAVDLGKLSLWLATLARDHAFTFLDHALRHGDSLVGLGRREIIGFHWKPSGEKTFTQDEIGKRLERATESRRQILDGAEWMTHLQKKEKLAKAEENLDFPRFIGNLVVAAHFMGENARQRNTRRDALFNQLQEWWESGRKLELRRPLNEAEASLRTGERPITPFHWEIEFPEVFGRENPGFDCMVGNPPFAGKNTIGDSNREGYLDWLKVLHAESHGNSDLVAHFFRRAFNLLRQDGTFGLIATNTIAQGDTRSTGLRWICTNDGTIYVAHKRFKWPGMAAVVVSVVHVARGQVEGPFELDSRKVPIITAFLFHAGGHEDPEKLKANENRSFIGSYVLGMGFTFDDTDKTGVASPIDEMHRLIEKDRRNAERIFPYIGGEEVNDSPTHAHHRYVINFGDMTEEEARHWPDLMRIVEKKVRPQRMKDNRDVRKRYWWRFAETTPALVAATQGLHRTLICSRHQPHWSTTFLNPASVFSEALVVITLPTYSTFCSLQSRVHEVWARFLGSSMKDDLRYTPSDCFETFPFPENFENQPQLEQAGRDYYEFRAALMVRNDEGLTKAYNRFHDPNETSPDIARLRELHTAMDRAVLDAYGWADLQPTCEFLLDYEEEDEEETGGRGRKKPYRYRWPDDFRDEVLARLLALNKERARQEKMAGTTARAPRKKRSKRRGGQEGLPGLPG